MKPTEKLAKAAPFAAGVIAVAAAVLLVVLILLAEMGAIVPRKINLGVEARDAMKTFDGEPLTGKLAVTHGELAEGHRLEILSQTSITTVGEAKNEIDFIIVDETGADVSNRYDISYQSGTLTVKPNTVTVQTSSATKAYDGTPLTKKDFVITAGKLASGHRLVTTASAELTSVGTAPNTMIFTVEDASGADVSYLYEVKVLEGRLTVTGYPLRINTASYSGIYNGTALSYDAFNLTQGTLLAGHTLFTKEATAFEGVGTVDNVIRVGVRDASGKDVTDIYNITYVYGQLTVTPRSISVQMGSVRKTYNGNPVGADSYTLLSGELCAGHTLSVVGKRRTEVGLTYNDMVSYTVIATLPNGQTMDVSNCYKVSYSAGTITVVAP